MYAIARALYREPVLFNGVVVALVTTLSAAGIIPIWVGGVAAAVGAVITRRFVSPSRGGT
ncbi:MAG TPA: hypothetical protein VMF31_00740 [Solirubrobacterales bacterium]|nr:hypothetical protein [Solirubrobacterales bacterium]